MDELIEILEDIKPDVDYEAQELLIAQQNIASLYDAERKEEEQKRRKDEQSH